MAGLTTGISNLPDAMASAILAGVSPITGLYALMAGTPVAALLTGSVLLNASASSAISITAGSTLARFPAGDERDAALATLTLVVGVILVVGGLLKVGRLLRFVSNAVMVGFLTGVSVLVVLSQLDDVTGYDSPLQNRVLGAIDLLFHLGDVVPQVVATGLLTVGAILVAGRTPLRNFSMLIGIAVGSVVAGVLDWTDVPTIADIAIIPDSLPLPSLPALAVAPELLGGAAAIALIAIVQGAGVSKGYPNPDGTYGDPSRDTLGVGAGNIASSLVGGLTIGGSVGSTALNVSSGARTRLANLVSAAVVVVAVLLLSSLVSQLAIPSMGALLIVAGLRSIRIGSIQAVWEIGPFPRSVLVATTVLVLTLPVQYAVLTAAVLSAIAAVVQASADVRVYAIVPGEGSRWLEVPAPARLPDRAVTILQILGSLSFAAADRVAELLPDPTGSDRPVVVLRLRQHVRLNSTLLVVLERYRQRVAAVGGRLLLAGVHEEVVAQLTAAGSLVPGLEPGDVFAAVPALGDSTGRAVAVGRAWLDAIDDPEDDPATPPASPEAGDMPDGR